MTKRCGGGGRGGRILFAPTPAPLASGYPKSLNSSVPQKPLHWSIGPPEVVNPAIINPFKQQKSSIEIYSVRMYHRVAHIQQYQTPKKPFVYYLRDWWQSAVVMLETFGSWLIRFTFILFFRIRGFFVEFSRQILVTWNSPKINRWQPTWSRERERIYLFLVLFSVW